METLKATTRDHHMSKPSFEFEARKFLAEASQFQLGVLPTETRHPKTTRLSQLAKDDLPAALNLFAEIDRDAIKSVFNQLAALEAMTRDIRATLASGGRIFLCGCGATGRLSISLETLWREEMARQGRADMKERVFGFIAGGDFALVRSIENFEDHPEFGVRQLHDLGFAANDLLISCTEGGETPFVIGATEEAARFSKRHPYFLFCNPVDVLKKTTERSRRVLENDFIHSISLMTGPMALSGSTRLQATTALMLAAGASMFAALQPQGSPAPWVEELWAAVDGADFARLAPLVQREAEVYANGGFCVHRTERYGITVLTDTTERTPTFSLLPFESPLDAKYEPSWTYLTILDAKTSLEAWGRVLGRDPRPINWENDRDKYGMTATLSYDFSPSSLERRKKLVGTDKLTIFDIESRGDEIVLSIDGREAKLAKPKSLLCEHLLLKCALNMTSTLVMGRLGRFHGNVMVYVRPTNKKLIDRSIRYIRLLLEDEGLPVPSYDDVCLALFEEFEHARQDEPVVVRTVERLRRQAKSSPGAGEI